MTLQHRCPWLSQSYIKSFTHFYQDFIWKKNPPQFDRNTKHLCQSQEFLVRRERVGRRRISSYPSYSLSLILILIPIPLLFGSRVPHHPPGTLLPFLTPPGPFPPFLPTLFDFSFLLYDFSQGLLLLLSEFYSWHIIPCCTKSTLVKAAAFEWLSRAAACRSVNLVQQGMGSQLPEKRGPILCLKMIKMSEGREICTKYKKGVEQRKERRGKRGKGSKEGRKRKMTLEQNHCWIRYRIFVCRCFQVKTKLYAYHKI